MSDKGLDRFNEFAAECVHLNFSGTSDTRRHLKTFRIITN